MIHNVYVLNRKTGEILFHKSFWFTEITERMLKDVIDTIAKLEESEDSIETEFGIDRLVIHLLNPRDIEIAFAYDTFGDLVFLVCGDPSENEKELLKKATKIKDHWIKTFGLDRTEPLNDEEQKEFLVKVNETVVSLLKIALIGPGGVGKTSIVKLVTTGEPTSEYVPTMAPDMRPMGSLVEQIMKGKEISEKYEWIVLGNKIIIAWDLPGQEMFRTFWKVYLKDADGVLLVMKSTLQGVITAKKILELIKEYSPNTPVWGIANFQDLPNALKPEMIERIIGIPTFPMVAIDPNRRTEMIRIIRAIALEKESAYL